MVGDSARVRRAGSEEDLRSAGARDVKNYGRALSPRRSAGTLLGRPIPSGAEGHWRWIRFLHPSNTWRPPLVCARLMLVLRQRPRWPRRFHSPCAAGLPIAAASLAALSTLVALDRILNLKQLWGRRDERPIPPRPETRRRIDRRRTSACALAKPIPRQSLFFSGQRYRLWIVLAVGWAGFKASACWPAFRPPSQLVSTMDCACSTRALARMERARELFLSSS